MILTDHFKLGIGVEESSDEIFTSKRECNQLELINPIGAGGAQDYE